MRFKKQLKRYKTYQNIPSTSSVECSASWLCRLKNYTCFHILLHSAAALPRLQRIERESSHWHTLCPAVFGAIQLQCLKQDSNKKIEAESVYVQTRMLSFVARNGSNLLSLAEW